MAYAYDVWAIEDHNDEDALHQSLKSMLAEAASEGWEVMQVIPISYKPYLTTGERIAGIQTPPTLDHFWTVAFQILLRRTVCDTSPQP